MQERPNENVRAFLVQTIEFLYFSDILYSAKERAKKEMKKTKTDDWREYAKWCVEGVFEFQKIFVSFFHLRMI